jgi:CRP-like cAMP-binding protein
MSHSENLRNSLLTIYPKADLLSLEAYIQCFVPFTFQRRETITNAGDTEQYLYVVMEGYQRSVVMHDNKELTVAFSYPGSFTGIPESFFTQKPSEASLECITDSVLWGISYQDHQRMMLVHPDIERISRIATEKVLAGLVDRYYEQQLLSMEERFHKFMQRSHALLLHIPHKYIASYLRIDPTNFSKLLKESTKA